MGGIQPDTILIFAANPSGLEPLRLDQEVREIQNALRHSRTHFEVRHQFATRPIDLRRALLDHQPSYVHFCGHGLGAAGIMLEGQLVDAEGLAELFKAFADRIKCVVLNACFSSIQAHAIVRHIDHVVGMSKEIGDEAALQFSTAFYDALGAGRSVEFAFALGRNAIQLAGISDHLTPQLLTRLPQQAPVSLADDPAGYLTKTTNQDWDGAPDASLLFGRDADADLLRKWILAESCRVVLITGLGGVGKTDLATCLGRGGNRSEGTSATLGAGIHGHFDAVIWRSLLNAPPPEDLLGDIADFLSEHRRVARASLHQLIDALVGVLKARHCLVILDNVEAILRPGDPGMRYRQGYEAYGAFFEQVAKSTHQSCLLLTSREKPRVIADLEGARKPVRSLALSGIGQEESQRLFSQIGNFTGTPADWERIVRLYSGNPLALELAARHIDQVFGGDLTAFFGVGRPVFADLQGLLDWHLDRLSDEETELVYWFAIEREPVNVMVLYEDLISPSSREALTSTLQSLQRRLPLERTGRAHFTLQPVLIERVTARLVNDIVTGFEKAIPDLLRRPTDARNSVATRALDALRPLNSHALVKATAHEHVRESQRRVILDPIGEHLKARHGRELTPVIKALLDACRTDQTSEYGYAAGNVINLLTHLRVKTDDLNFSRLPIWQACLQDVTLHSTDFSSCHFRHSTFRHPFGTVFSLAYSSNGDSLAVGDDNGEIHLFHAVNGQFARRYVGHTDVVFAIAFSPDGQTMASGSFDNTIRLWNAHDGRCVNVLLGHHSWIYGLSFAADGKTLASVSEDGTCRLWNVQTGQWSAPKIETTGFLSSVVFSADGTVLAVAGSDPDVHLFRVSDLEHPTRLKRHDARVRALAFSAQGDLLASAGEDRLIHLWDPESGAHLAALSGHAESITSLSFSAAGDVLASASYDQTVRLWSTTRQICVGQMRIAPARVWSVQCNPAGRTLATGSEDGAVRVWNIDTSECQMTLRGYSNKTWALAFMPDRSRLLAANEDGVVRAWDIREARTVLELRGHISRVWAVACSADGRWAASASDDLSVRVWDMRTGECRHVMHGHTDWIRDVAFDPSGRLLVSAGEDGRIFSWDVVTGARVHEIDGGMTRVFAIAFCAHGSVIVAGGSEPALHLFSAATGHRVGELKGHVGWLNAIDTIDAEASLVASCNDDGTIKLWDASQQQCLGTLTVGSKVTSGVFCDRGASFLSGTDDGMLRRWDVASQRCVAEAQAHQGAVWSVAVNASADVHAPADIVASAGNDGNIRLWLLPDLTPYQPVNTLRPTKPYEAMNITGATNLTSAQRDALLALGAISMPTFQ